MFRRMLQYVSEELVYFAASLPYRINPDSIDSHSKVLVNGPPKTGTTWMYSMIRSLPGYTFLGNFLFNIEQYATLRPGDIVHGHDLYSKEIHQILQENNIKLILMQRDPRDQIVSHMYHIYRVPNHDWHATFQKMRKDDALMLSIEGRMGDGPDFLGGAEFWVKFINIWIDNFPDLLLVRYEDLLNDTPTELLRVFSYIDFTASKNFSHLIAERNRFERLSSGRKFWRTERKPGNEDNQSQFRKGISGDWKNHFKKSHKERFKELAGESLIKFGYEQDMSW